MCKRTFCYVLRNRMLHDAGQSIAPIFAYLDIIVVFVRGYMIYSMICSAFGVFHHQPYPKIGKRSALSGPSAKNTLLSDILIVHWTICYFISQHRVSPPCASDLSTVVIRTLQASAT